MRYPPTVHPWLSERELESWVDASTTREDYQRRLAIFWLATRRTFTHEVASMLRVGRSTVWTWLRAYNRAGPAGVAAKSRGGRRDAFLTLEEERALLTSLEAQAARGEFVVAAQLHGAVEHAVGHAVSRAYVSRLLHRHRWRKVAPRPRHPKADSAMQATFRESFPETLAAIAREVPPGKRLRVLFEDEASFGRITEVRRCWAPPGVRPTAPRQQVREYRQALAAVCPHDGKLSWMLAPRLDAVAMSAFLAATRRRFPRDYCAIFLDGAGWHIAGTLRVPAHMRLVFLPPYSPELNPVEPLWDHLREKYFANQLFPTLRAVEQRLEAAFADLQASPELVRSITDFSWIKSPGLM